LLTGRYPFRTGLLDNHSNQAIQPGKETMIPTLLKMAGYVTASVGKWGQMSFGPGEWGFDEYLVFPGSGRYWRDQTTTYRQNGETKNLPEGAYLPELMHSFLVDFIARHKAQPFFIYYPMSHIHGPIVPTPDSKPGADKSQLCIDNITYMDKLVGKLMDELNRQHLRENTLVLFLGDNGTAHFGVDTATVDGRRISGMKGAMLEGGSRVPFIANWKGTAPEGLVLKDLVDFSDVFVSVAELAGAKLPDGVMLDGHSFAPQVRGEKGVPREWVYVQLGPKWYVREQGFKLTQSGELFDMANAPFEEKPVSSGADNAEARAAQVRLQVALDILNPASGKTVGPDLKKGKGSKKKVKAKDKPKKRNNL
jgi:arylsulfatase A